MSRWLVMVVVAAAAMGGAVVVESPRSLTASALSRVGAPATERSGFGAGADRGFLVHVAAPVAADERQRTAGGWTLRLHPGGSSVAVHRVVVVSAGGARSIDRSVRTFAGYVVGVPESYAFVGVASSGVYGYMAAGGETYVLGDADHETADAGPRLAPAGGSAAQPRATPLPDGRGSVRVDAFALPHALQARRLATLGVAEPWSCGALPPGGEAPAPPPIAPRIVPIGRRVLREADLFMECDHRMRALFDSAEETADYVLLLLGAVSDIYRRDLGVVLRIPDGYLRVWEVPPPWGTSYSEFINYWRSEENPLRDLPRAAVHLLRDRGGGVATVGGVCRPKDGYGTSGLNGFFPHPIEHTSPDNWDLYVVAHELGHTFGSIHTFEYDPPIECEDGSGPDRGTIMSYCNQGGCGIQCVGMRFHAYVQGVIRGRIATTACLPSAYLKPGDYDGDEHLTDRDLAAAETCLQLGFEAAGCIDAFDVAPVDGRLTPCDYDYLARQLHPHRPIADCDGDGVNDCDQMRRQGLPDCNGNGVLDLCDVTTGRSGDCDANLIPDECEDCNGNGLADACDLRDGTSEDCTGNGVPDECEPDCNKNLRADSCDIADGTSRDRNGNDIPDECEAARRLRVPVDFPTIGDAIAAAVDGNWIDVAPGLYQGSGNRDLDPEGRAIAIICSVGADCVIDAEGKGAGFAFRSGEGEHTSVSGCTVTRATTGVILDGSAPALENMLIVGNLGDGISCENEAAPLLAGLTIAGNGGWGLRGSGPVGTVLSGAIVWGNKLGGIHDEGGAVTVRYCAVQGGYEGEGNIAADPLLVDAANGDYHLRPDSPCIDAGDPGFPLRQGGWDIDGAFRIFDYHVDIGTDEFHDCNENGTDDRLDIASGDSRDANSNRVPDECEGACCVWRFCTMVTRERCELTSCLRRPQWLCDADVTGDGHIDHIDVLAVQLAFGRTGAQDLCNYDVTCDGVINAVDAGYVAARFGTCDPPPAACHPGEWHEGQPCNPNPCD